jgi:hypothetical protein
MTVIMSLDPSELAVDAGGQAISTITIKNTSSIVERFSFVVLGAASPWAEVDPAAISLLPDHERTVSLRFHPPRQPVPHAGMIPFAVKVLPTEQHDDTAVEEGEITVNPFVELVPALTPQNSRGARVGRHTLRMTNTGNTALDATVSLNDPDDQLTLRARPSRVGIGPGVTVRTRIEARARRTRLVGPPEVHPFQVKIDRPGAQTTVLNGTLQQRSLIPKWLPRAAVAVAVLAVGAVALAAKESHVNDAATLTSTTLPPSTTAPSSTGGGSSTTTTTTTSSTSSTVPPGLEAGLALTDLSCDTYDPTKIQTSGPTGSAASTTSSTTPVYTLTASAVTFTFSNPQDVDLAKALMMQYSQVCYIGRGSLLSQQAMTFEPYNAQLPHFPNGTSEKCTSYNAGQLMAEPIGAGHSSAWVGDFSANPPTVIQNLDNNTDAATAKALAAAHKQRCWIGGGSTWSSLQSQDNTTILEYWR